MVVFLDLGFRRSLRHSCTFSHGYLNSKIAKHKLQSVKQQGTLGEFQGSICISFVVKHTQTKIYPEKLMLVDFSPFDFLRLNISVNLRPDPALLVSTGSGTMTFRFTPLTGAPSGWSPTIRPLDLHSIWGVGDDF